MTHYWKMSVWQIHLKNSGFWTCLQSRLFHAWYFLDLHFFETISPYAFRHIKPFSFPPLCICQIWRLSFLCMSLLLVNNPIHHRRSLNPWGLRRQHNKPPLRLLDFSECNSFPYFATCIPNWFKLLKNCHFQNETRSKLRETGEIKSQVFLSQWSF